MRKYIIPFISAIFFIGCSSSYKEWPMSDQHSFLKNCISNQSIEKNPEILCSCVLEKIMLQYSSLSDLNKESLQNWEETDLIYTTFLLDCLGADFNNE